MANLLQANGVLCCRTHYCRNDKLSRIIELGYVSLIIKNQDSVQLTYWDLNKLPDILQTGDIFKYILSKETFCIFTYKILPKFATNALINKMSALVQVMAWQQALTWANDDPFP